MASKLVLFAPLLLPLSFSIATKNEVWKESGFREEGEVAMEESGTVFSFLALFSLPPPSLSSLSTKNTEREKRATDHHHDAVRACAHAAG